MPLTARPQSVSFQTQTWRAPLWSQHTVACFRRPRLVAVRRSVGRGRNVERQLRCCASGHCSCCWRCRHRPQAQLTVYRDFESRNDRIARVASRFGYGVPTYEEAPADCAACPIHACVAFLTVTYRTSVLDLQLFHERAATSELLVMSDVGDETLQALTVAIASTALRADAKFVLDTPDPFPPLIGMLVSAVP